MDFIPVTTFHQAFRVVRPAVLILQGIGVFPNVIAKHRELAVADGIVLIGGRSNFEFTRLGLHQPGPATAKLVDAGGFELFLERIKAPKVLL